MADVPQSFVWAWYRPPTVPEGVCVQIPPETFRHPLRRQPVSLRTLLYSLGIAPTEVAVWSLFGNPYDGTVLADPNWDFPIPEPGAVPDPTLVIYVRAAVAPAVPTMPLAYQPIAPATAAPASAGTAGPSDKAFERIDADWNHAQQLEQHVDAAAKQLNATLMRVNSLNRDLSPEENRSADSNDKREWQEARRWLRDVSGRIGRYLKDHTVGMTSNVGKRSNLESIYNQYIVPRRSYDGLAQAERDFETYRKNLQTLLNNLTSSNSSAVQDGERRAQQVMSRVAAKIRNSRAKL
ncbi:MAG: hypothetical protein JSS02_21670 [Planctomycetes bacterium]|nr:hypothetical protein [Planctomycetota bacterium]